MRSYCVTNSYNIQPSNNRTNETEAEPNRTNVYMDFVERAAVAHSNLNAHINRILIPRRGSGHCSDATRTAFVVFLSSGHSLHSYSPFLDLLIVSRMQCEIAIKMKLFNEGDATIIKCISHVSMFYPFLVSFFDKRKVLFIMETHVSFAIFSFRL